MDKLLAVQHYTNAGYTILPLRGKIPLTKNWVKTSYDPFVNPENFESCNIGIRLDYTDLIIDADPRNYIGGRNSLTNLLNDIGFNAKETLVVRTGGGGFHIYLKKDPDVKVVSKLDKYPGVEFKSYGQQVVAIGSIHPDTKALYTIKYGSFNSILDAPKALIDLISKRHHNLGTVVTPIKGYDDSIANKNHFTKCLDAIPSAVEGAGGDAQTLRAAMVGRDLGLSPAITLELMEENYNPRCEPPWDPNDLAEKVRNAYSYAKDSVGNRNPVNDFANINVGDTAPLKDIPAVDLKWDWKDDKDGNHIMMLPTINNVVNYLKWEKGPLYNLIVFDELSRNLRFTRKAPWHGEYSPVNLSDADIAQMQLFFEDNDLCRKNGFKPNDKQILTGIIAYAESNRVHPVREYLNSLEWDQKLRLDTWLTDYCQAERNLYTGIVGSKTLIAAVARVFEPGIKFDNMLVLEGDQGIGKSTLCNILGGAYFGEFNSNLYDVRQTVENMVGLWFIEFSELASLKTAGTQRIKQFLSQRFDKVRPVYKRIVETVPRQCIFIGTVNNDGSGYLEDTTGNRRFWPVEIKKVDFEGLKNNRDQLFAEAVYRFKNGESVYCDTEEFLQKAQDEVVAKELEEPWTETIINYASRCQDGFTTFDVLEFAIFIGTKDMKRGGPESKRIGSVLRKAGYKLITTRRKDGGYHKIWKR